MARLTLAVVSLLIFASGFSSPRADAAPPDACSLLTQVQIKSAIGADVSEGVAGSAKLCQWNASLAPGAKVNFVTLVLQDPNFFAGGKTAPAPAIVTPVSGIGDDAYFVAVRDQVGLVVKKGSSAFKVAVYAKLPIDQKESMEKTLAAQIALQL
jgi:hypothetical protein